ncbi:amidohydrolase family protein [Roseibium sp.]|uniref:metal-dependent hydrolase family protein n=1 Tax=Roseibium sp. TaxID=1936156 RepID=UPI003D0EC53A
MKRLLKLAIGIAMGTSLVGGGVAAQVAAPPEPQRTLVTNTRIFDGTSSSLSGPMSVLVEGNKIAKIGKSITAPSGATVIDAEGRTLMPGLADTHVHLAFVTLPAAQVMTGLPSYNHIYSTVDARDMLMRGFTTVRDMGGNTFGLKQAIDEGLVPGPRIYPSGPMISQTAGHGDFRFPNQDNPRFGGERSAPDRENEFRQVDGVPDMLAAVRENLRHGASHIKLATGGGYASPSDPLMGNQYTFEEIKAAVDAAADWQTYVTVHAYHPSSINRAIDAGIKDVGHGQLLDKATLQRMADKGVFLSTQPFTVCSEPQLSDFSNEKLAVVCKGTALVYETAKKIPGLKVTYGTDMFNVPQEVAEQQARMMERLLPWYSPVEILRMATGTAGELFKMSGLRNPYPGDLGVVKEGAYADLLLVEGNPLEDLKAVTDSDNLKIIMKDGKIYKNTL